MSQKIHPKSLRVSRIFHNTANWYTEHHNTSLWNSLSQVSMFVSHLLTETQKFKASKAPSSRRRKKNNLLITSLKMNTANQKVFVSPVFTLLPQKGLSSKFLPIQKDRKKFIKLRK